VKIVVLLPAEVRPSTIFTTIFTVVTGALEDHYSTALGSAALSTACPIPLV
jgi:hypothetical protein